MGTVLGVICAFVFLLAWAACSAAGAYDDWNEYDDPLVDPDFVCLIVDDNDKLMGFGVGAPSTAEAMRKCGGHLMPTGWIGLLKALMQKNDTLDLLLIAVRPEYQKTGLNGVIMEHLFTGCNKNGIRKAETGPQLEYNTNVHHQWKMFDIEPHKRRRCFVKQI